MVGEKTNKKHIGQNKSPVKTKYINTKTTTLPETNMAPENGWLEDESPFGAFRPIFRGGNVSGRVSSFRGAKKIT